MASETIQKLEPHRTMNLRGIDRMGAMGALWGASATGFSMSGVFRDQADFAVLTLWDADDYFGHWQTTKYLPDFDFTGMVLSFDIAFSGVQPFDSPMYPWVPYRSLSYIAENGESGTVDLQPYTTYASGANAKASATLAIYGSAPQPNDTVTVWYQNIAFQYEVSGSSAGITMSYFGGTPSKVHGLVIGSNIYNLTEDSGSGSTGAQIASGLAAAAAADPNGIATASANSVVVTPKLNTGAIVTVGDGGSDGNGTGDLWESTGDPSWLVAAQLAQQINNYNWTAGGVLLTLTATTAGNAITITSGAAGLDGNSVTLYTTNSSSRLYATPSVAPLTGGASSATWAVSIDFSALGITSLRQAWFTFAPQLAASAAYTDTEWTVTVTNWSVADPNGKRPLSIAGPGSVRVGSRDAWVNYSGSSWIEEASGEAGGTGWFHRGFAHRMSTPGDFVTVVYSCGETHDVYLGTSLYSDRGIVTVTIDGESPTTLDGFLGTVPSGPVVTRRKLFSGIAAGAHTVFLTLTSGHHGDTLHPLLGTWDVPSTGYYFYFDYLEAAIASDVLDPAVTYPTVMPATDWDTDHGYMLSPERLVWMLSRLGFAGQLDHYLGVFWWNQRTRGGGSFPSWVVTFGGTWASGDKAFLDIGGITLRKSVFAGDTTSTIAAHFCYFINSTFTGVWASVAGAVLTVTCRTPEWSFTPISYSNTSSAGTISATGSLSGGVEGVWQINDTITPVLNRAATDWHADFFAQVFVQGWAATASLSMELVNPPDATGHVYAQRFRDGTAVVTATGFGGLNSTQCTFNAVVRAYQQEAYKELAGLMATAGLVPWLQFGEFVWWFISNYDATANPSGGMAFYDADTAFFSAAVLGRPLATFLTVSDDPSVNAYADANYLRQLISGHCQAIATFVLSSYPTAKFEALFPLDVNYPSVVPIALSGGKLLAYVNLPSAWMAKLGSGLDRMKMEGLAFGATARNLTLAQQAIAFPTAAPMTWALADTAYMIPVFNGGCPWTLEFLATLAAGTPLVNLWAFDQFCLMSWPVPLPAPGAAAF